MPIRKLGDLSASCVKDEEPGLLDVHYYDRLMSFDAFVNEGTAII